MRLLAVPLSLALAAGAAVAAPASAASAHCAVTAITVPGAALTRAPACLADLTTPGLIATGNTDESDWATLTSARTALQPAAPGVQVDGYFTDDDSTTNTENGLNRDSQFVARFPDAWNGKLMITGAPGVRKQYAVDRAISDWAVAHGYAYASTDKGNSGDAFYADGPSRPSPGDAVAEWHYRVTELTVAMKQVVRQVYGRGADRTYMTGISNGGYLTRKAVEDHPELYDGAVDWEGTLFTRDQNLFTYLPVALQHYPAAQAGSKADHDAMVAAGFAPGSEVVWPEHYAVYWDLTQRVYRQEFDPTYSTVAAGVPYCQVNVAGCDTFYSYASRPPAVHDAVGRPDVALTGRVTKPMITLHGTLDSLLPIAVDSDVYDRMVQAAGDGANHRYYRVQGGNHVDSFADASGGAVRPVLPCYYAALDALDSWVTRGTPPPASGEVPRVPGQTADQEANTCALPGQADAPGPVVPEVPAAALLPLAAVAVLGTGWWLRRRA